LEGHDNWKRLDSVPLLQVQFGRTKGEETMVNLLGGKEMKVLGSEVPSSRSSALAWTIRRVAMALLAVSALVLAACQSASATTAEVGKSSAHGTAIKIMVIADIASSELALPQVVTGAQAAVNNINAAGGVNGHPLDLLHCNSQADPNAAAACAREAVSDHVSAVVGMESLQSGSAVPILQAAKIPSIGATDLSPPDHTSPDSFPIMSSDIQDIALAALTPGWKSCKRPAIAVDSDIPVIVVGVSLISKLYESLPNPITPKTVTITSATLNPSPQVAELLSGHPDCVFISETQTGTLPTLEDIYASGQKPKITVMLSVADPKSMKQLGNAANGVYASSYFELPGSSGAANEFAKSFDAVDANGQDDTNAEASYSAVYMFKSVAAHLTNFSSVNVLSAMDKATNISTPLMATLPSFPANSGVPSYPRVDFFDFYGYQWNNGKYNLLQPKPLNIHSSVLKALK
jgi:ABC-type branched-subunit amino acid transport system substrate-binding protein